ncbi:MAG: hypothetical protein Q9160_007942 [Pyrenula sp. 1 TL-2023]
MRGTPGETWRLSAARLEHDVLHQFRIPVPAVFYDEYTHDHGVMKSRQVPIALQLRLINRTFASEISKILFRGSVDGAELWITVTNDIIELCSRAVASEATNDSSMAEVEHRIDVDVAANILCWIRRWTRLVFLLPGSNFEDLAMLLETIDPEREHRIKILVTGFEDYFWDSREYEVFPRHRHRNGNGQLPSYISESDLFSHIESSKKIEMRYALDKYLVQSPYHRRTIYYRLDFHAKYAKGEAQVDLEGVFIHGARKGVLQKICGYEPELMLPPDSVLPRNGEEREPGELLL